LDLMRRPTRQSRSQAAREQRRRRRDERWRTVWKGLPAERPEPGFGGWFRRIRPILFMVLLILSLALTRSPWRLVLLELAVLALGSTLGLTGVLARVAKRIGKAVPGELEEQVVGVARAVGIPAPAVVMMPGHDHNGFAIALPGKAVLGLTRGMVEHGSAAELRGTIAHEMAHLARLDMLRSGAVSLAFTAVATLLWWLAPWPVALVGNVTGYLAMLSYFRRIEMAADRFGARLAGDPGCLLAGLEVGRDRRGLLERLFATHPSIAQRRAALLSRSGHG
jgi:Zn-dependent protease with chaperone function